MPNRESVALSCGGSIIIRHRLQTGRNFRRYVAALRPLVFLLFLGVPEPEKHDRA